MTIDLAKQFEELWESGNSAPDVFEFLEQHNDSNADQRLAVLLADQSRRWKTDNPLTVEDYLSKLPDFANDPKAVLHLINGEFENGTAVDSSPTGKELLERLQKIHSDRSHVRPNPDTFGETLSFAKQSAVESTVDSNWTGAPSTRIELSEYEMIEEIGRGGMGVVYKARHKKLNRLVALKLIKSGELADSEQVQRFQSEAEALGKLDHPGIVPVFDVGQADGQHFFTMAFVSGESLNERVKAQGPLPPSDAASLIKLVAEAVQYAHKKGVVHRDIKPHNILIDSESGKPRLTDFGLAKRLETGSDLTATGQVLGTPSYMPPEQAAGQTGDVDVASDVYSLGATLYYLLVARPPFQAASSVETIRQVMERDPVSPRSLNANVPKDLETVCLKCLSKDPESRYAGAGDLADDLQRWLNGEPIVARPVSRIEKAWKWCKRRPALVGTAAAAVFILFVVSTIFTQRQNASYVKALIESLSAANTADVENLVGEIGEYRQWATHLLQDIVAHEDSSPKEKLHASLALVKDDPSQVDFLFQQLLSAKTDEVPVIVTFLKPHRGQLEKQLWEAIEDGSNSERIRAAVAQAEFDSQSKQWGQVCEDVATALVSVPSSESDEWIEMLRPVGSVLVDPLERRFKGRSSIRIVERPIVAAALADYLGDDPQLVKEFILLADNDREFQPLLLALRNHEQIVAGELRSLLSQSPPENINPHERNNFWKMQANAAVCLLELGETDSVWPLFQQSPNPSLRSFIIDRIAPLGANHEPIAAQIMNESDPATRYALVLALGQFDVGKMSSQQRKKLFDQLETLYRRDPEPGVHSAAGWALRNRQKNLDLSDLDAEFIKDAPKGDRNWFVNSQGQTFAIAQGSLEFSEAEETKEAEPSKAKTISHRFAMATHEVTVAQFQKFRSDHKHNSQYAQEPDSPVNMLRWDDAMAYCNWLSQQEGIPKDQWCYPNPRGFDLPISLQGRDDVPADYLERTGYRLPTEQEWEFICRGGTTSAYSYGEPVELLARYAWYLNNSDSHLWPVGKKLPNALGMFDTHGNVKEWCRRYVLGGSVEDPPELLRMNAEIMSGSAGSFGLRPARTMPR